MPAALPSIRSSLPLTDRVAYLNSGWSGPLPTPVRQAMERELRRDADEGATVRTVLQARRELDIGLRSQIAAAVHADADEIALTRNTTEGMNIVFNGVSWQPGDVVVSTTVEHSSGLVPCYFLRDRHGVELRFVKTDASDAQADMIAKFEAAVTPGTRLVVLSHISYATGQIFPLAEIQRLVHRAGARVLVDGAQGLGHLPLNFHADDVDYYAMAGHKWLLGPSGQGALFVRRDLITELEPMAVAYGAAQSIDYRGGGFSPRRDAIAKFELTSSSAALQAGMAAALHLYQTAGPEAVWQRIRALAGYAARQVTASEGLTLASPADPAEQSGLVTFTAKGLPADHVSEYLETAAGVVARSVSEVDAVRLSTHYFNTEAEIDHAVAAAARVVKGAVQASV